MWHGDWSANAWTGAWWSSPAADDKGDEEWDTKHDKASVIAWYAKAVPCEEGSGGTEGTSSPGASSSHQNTKPATEGETDGEMMVDAPHTATDPDDKEYAVITTGETKVKTAQKRKKKLKKEANKKLVTAAAEGAAIEFNARTLTQVASLQRLYESRAKNLGRPPTCSARRAVQSRHGHGREGRRRQRARPR